MRIIIIILVLVGAIGFGAYKTFQMFSPQYQTERRHERMVDAGLEIPEPPESGELEKREAVHSGQSSSTPSPVEVKKDETAQLKAQLDAISKTVSEYKRTEDEQNARLQHAEEEKQRLQAQLDKKNEVMTFAVPFLNRPVLPLSALSSSEAINTDSFNIIVDKLSNSWIVKGNQEFIDSTVELVKRLDQSPQTLDLDFLVVAINEEKIRRLGLTGMFQDGASYLNSIDLTFDTFGLNLALGNTNLTLDFQHTDEETFVVTLPVERVTTGAQFEFGNVDRIPIQTLTVSDGISQSGFDYKSVGLTFKGQLNKVSERYYLELDHSVGSVVGEYTSSAPPVFRESSSRSQAFVELNMWSVMSGMMVERSTWSRGILSRKKSNTRDLVLVFVRPRDQLRAIPKAIPCLPDADVHPLLPPLEDSFPSLDGYIEVTPDK